MSNFWDRKRGKVNFPETLNVSIGNNTNTGDGQLLLIISILILNGIVIIGMKIFKII